MTTFINNSQEVALWDKSYAKCLFLPSGLEERNRENEESIDAFRKWTVSGERQHLVKIKQEKECLANKEESAPKGAETQRNIMALLFP